MTADGIVVAEVDDVPEGEAIKIDAAVLGTVDDIALFNDDGEFFALDPDFAGVVGVTTMLR